MPEGLDIELMQPPERLSGGYREVVVEPGRFRATHRWWSLAGTRTAAFALCWNAAIGVVYAGLLTEFSVRTFGGILSLLFPVPHVFAGAFLVWWVIACRFNVSTIEVREGRVTCREGPVPWPFNRPESVALQDVERLHVGSTRARNDPKRDVMIWRVVAEMRDGREIRVVTRLATSAQARFLADRLEEYLGRPSRCQPDSREQTPTQVDEIRSSSSERGSRTC